MEFIIAAILIAAFVLSIRWIEYGASHKADAFVIGGLTGKKAKASRIYHLVSAFSMLIGSILGLVLLIKLRM